MFLFRILFLLLAAGCFYYDYTLWPVAKMFNEPVTWGIFAFFAIVGLILVQIAFKKK